MFAVIRTGGKQYRVADGQRIVVEKLDGAPGSVVELRDVLMIDDGEAPQVGTPTLDQAAVFAEVIADGLSTCPRLELLPLSSTRKESASAASRLTCSAG